MKRNVGDIWKTKAGEINIKNKLNKTQSYHRYLVEEYLGFTIPKGLIIHHINFNHYDNYLANFLIIPAALHIWIHRTKCSYLSSNLETFKNNFISENAAKLNM